MYVSALRRLCAWVFLISSVCPAAELSIIPKTPAVVFEGGSFKFSGGRNVEWSLAPGSKGSIDPDGTYHAPLHVPVKQSVAGCQVLPNNHVLNTRVDSLPLHPKSREWMNFAATNGGRLAGGKLRYSISFPINTITSQTPTQKMTFAYTPAANGPFHILPASDFKMEAGYYTEAFGGIDRHSIMVETDTCHFQEMYNFYPVGSNTYNNCAQCTSQSGVQYSGSDYKLPKAATDAASLLLTPLSLHRDEVLSGAINHALRFTLAAAFTKQAHLWPAVGDAGYNHTDVPPFGTRFRLRSDFAFQSNNPYVKTLVNQLKQYGLILADIGGQWEIDSSDVDLYFDPAIRAALIEIRDLVPPANFEVVDESGLMLNPDSGDTAYDAETVIAKDKTSGKTETVRIVLVGVTIGTAEQILVMQSNAPAHPLQAWVNGSSDKKILWTMQPAVGTLTTDGIYTPPASVSDKQELFITARADADAAAVTTIKIILLPAGPIRIDNGSPANTTDSEGNTWLAECCTPVSFTWDYSGIGAWPNRNDIKLYRDDTVNWSDLTYRFYVPPGKYKVTAKIAEPSNAAPNLRKIHLESQGQLIYRDVDLFAQFGLRNPADFDLPAEVGPDGKLNFIVRHVKGEQALLGALQITNDTGSPRIQISPSQNSSLSVLQTQQFRIVNWYTSATNITWSISPKLGSIDSTGLYKAPATPIPEDKVVTITAKSSVDPRLAASTSVTISKGIPAIRVNCGGPEFTDAQQHVWSGDYGFSDGTKYDEGNTIKGAAADMQTLYRSSRYGYEADRFAYSFALPNGHYKVTLKWAEYRTASEFSAEHILYKMSVKINGKRVLDNFDPIAAAGGVNIAYDRTFPVSVTKSRIRIDFAGQPGAGYVGSGINGIEIEPVE